MFYRVAKQDGANDPLNAKKPRYAQRALPKGGVQAGVQAD
jgi:hypothetical protein